MRGAEYYSAASRSAMEARVRIDRFTAGLGGVTLVTLLLLTVQLAVDSATLASVFGPGA